MAQFAPIQIKYNPQNTYPGTQQNSWVGAQSVEGQRMAPKVAEWQFQNNLNDATGNGYTLVPVGSTSFQTTPAPPAQTYCVGPFSGSNYFTCSALENVLNDLRQFRIDFWIYTSALSTTTDVINFGGSSTSFNCYLNVATGGYTVSFQNHIPVTPQYPAITSSTLLMNTWYQVSLVATDTGRTLSIDRSVNASDGQFMFLPDAISVTAIGPIAAGWTGYFYDMVIYGSYSNGNNSLFVGGANASDSNPGTPALPFATIHHAFDTVGTAGSDPGQLTDASGNGNALVSVGAVPVLNYPTYPAPPASPTPPQGNFSAGPFSSSNYFGSPALAASLGSLQPANWTFEAYLYINSFPNANNMFFSFTSNGADSWLAVSGPGSILGASGYLGAVLNGLPIQYSSAYTLLPGQWYHVGCSVNGGNVAFYVNNVYTGFQGFSSAVNWGTGVTALALGTYSSNTSDCFAGYMDRVIVSTTNQTTFPTQRSNSNILAVYNFETDPAVLTLSKTIGYLPVSVVVQDSGVYNEREYINFPDDLTNVGLFAADGQTPTLTVLRGAIQGTYGAGNAARLTPPTPTPGLHVAKIGGDYTTIQAALNAASGGNVIQIDDSAVYVEDLKISTGNVTIQAALGQTPVLRNVNTSSLGLHIQTSTSNWTVSLYGLTLDDQHSAGSVLGGISGSNYSLFDCTFRNNNILAVDGPEVTATNTLFFDISIQGPVAFSMTNCFVTSNMLSTCTISGYPLIFKQCSFTNQNVNFSGIDSGPQSQVLNCSFQQSNFNFGATIPGVQLTVQNCQFYSGGLGVAVPTGGTSASLYAENVLVSGASSAGYNVSTSTDPFSRGTASAVFNNCIAIGCGVGFQGLDSSQTAQLTHCTSIGAGTNAVNTAGGWTVTGFAEAGSGSTPFVGVTPTLSEMGVDMISTSVTSPNAALNPADAANLGGNVAATLNMGLESALIQVNLPGFTIDGFILTGPINQENGISSPGSLFYPVGTGFNVYSCTLNGFGMYGVKATQVDQTVSNCLFATNGYGVQLAGNLDTVEYCVFNGCGSAGIANDSQNATINNCSAYGCLYGQFDQASSFTLSLENNIYSSSGAFDYSGNNQQTYACIGTLDPDTNASLDANSTMLDPLFRNLLNGDFRLQTVENGYYFNSPAKLAGSDGDDMGAFEYLYGPLNQVWTAFTLTNNPDQIDRNQIVIKAAEGDTEGGNLYSTGRSFQTLYKFIWNDNNPMPPSDLAFLTGVFSTGNGQCQLSFDGGNTWVPVRVVRSSGFEWNDLDMMYNDNNKPTPVREIDFRVSA